MREIPNSIYDSSDGSLAPYVHEGMLVCWPESTVFWAKAIQLSGFSALYPSPDRFKIPKKPCGYM